jgi:hypothetical protein
LRSYWSGGALRTVGASDTGRPLRPSDTLRADQSGRTAGPVAKGIDDRPPIDGDRPRVDVAIAHVDSIARQLREGLRSDLGARRHFRIGADAHAEEQIAAAKEIDRESSNAAEFGLEQAIAHLHCRVRLRPER